MCRVQSCPEDSLFQLKRSEPLLYKGRHKQGRARKVALVQPGKPCLAMTASKTSSQLGNVKIAAQLVVTPDEQNNVQAIAADQHCWHATKFHHNSPAANIMDHANHQLFIPSIFARINKSVNFVDYHIGSGSAWLQHDCRAKVWMRWVVPAILSAGNGRLERKGLKESKLQQEKT